MKRKSVCRNENSLGLSKFYYGDSNPPPDHYFNRGFGDLELIPMPIENLHIKTFKRPDDKPCERDELLFQSGAWVMATIFSPDESNEDAAEGYMLVDTGAHRCSFRGDIIDLLQIEPDVNLKETSGMNGVLLEQTVSNVVIHFNNLEFHLTLPLSSVMRDGGLEDFKRRHPSNHIGILGRDVLSCCKLTYDGPNGVAALEFAKKTVVETPVSASM